MVRAPRSLIPVPASSSRIEVTFHRELLGLGVEADDVYELPRVADDPASASEAHGIVQPGDLVESVNGTYLADGGKGDQDTLTVLEQLVSGSARPLIIHFLRPTSEFSTFLNILSSLEGN